VDEELGTLRGGEVFLVDLLDGLPPLDVLAFRVDNVAVGAKEVGQCLGIPLVERRDERFRPLQKDVLLRVLRGLRLRRLRAEQGHAKCC
jgi:hypothetical protein